MWVCLRRLTLHRFWFVRGRRRRIAERQGTPGRVPGRPLQPHV
nr:MAG TPA: hypothetical protein [Bacteriophage sp.]